MFIYAGTPNQLGIAFKLPFIDTDSQIILTSSKN